MQGEMTKGTTTLKGSAEGLRLKEKVRSAQGKGGDNFKEWSLGH
jgi:hypothetical protein